MLNIRFPTVDQLATPAPPAAATPSSTVAFAGLLAAIDAVLPVTPAVTQPALPPVGTATVTPPVSEAATPAPVKATPRASPAKTVAAHGSTAKDQPSVTPSDAPPQSNVVVAPQPAQIGVRPTIAVPAEVEVSEPANQQIQAPTLTIGGIVVHPAPPPSHQDAPAPPAAAVDGGLAPVPFVSPSTPTTAATPIQKAERAAPAAQAAPVIVQLVHAPGGGTMTLRLDPAGLGHVEVRVERAADGTANVQVAVERPDTLRLLLADAPHLHRALDNAGVPSDGRSLSLSLDSSGSGSGGGARQDRSAFHGTAPEAATAITTAWLRAGVDITA